METVSAAAAGGAGASIHPPAPTAASYRASNFKPEDLGLRPTFRLTDFSKLKGCACKVPQEKLLGYIAGISNDLRPNEAPGAMDKPPHTGPWYVGPAAGREGYAARPARL